MSEDNLPHGSDVELIDKIKAKSSESELAWKLLIERHQSIVYKLTSRFSYQDTSRQDDLSQKIWLKVFEKIESFEAKAKFSTWLYQVGRNTCLDEIKRRDCEMPDELPDEIPDETDDNHNNDTVECMTKAWELFKRKNPDCFDILQLYYSIGYTWNEVGVRLGKSASAVKEQGNQCLKKFKPMAQEMCSDA